MPEYGKVMFYDTHKKFGMLESVTAQSDVAEGVYFHLYGGRLVSHTLSGTNFGSKPKGEVYHRTPQAGEVLIFERVSTDKGFKANRWAFADVWDKTAVYRVTVTTLITFEDKVQDESVVWEGSDTDKLSRLFPPSNILGADPLFKLDLEDGWIRFKTRYERLTPQGTWRRCDDPRYRITPVTELELAIDAENRKRWPGDYEQ